MAKEIVALSETEKKIITKNVKFHFFIGVFPVVIFVLFFLILIQETFHSKFNLQFFLYILADFIVLILVYAAINYFYIKPYFHIKSRNKTMITSKISSIHKRIRNKKGIQYKIQCEDIMIDNFAIHFLNIRKTTFDYSILKVGDLLNIEFLENHPEKILFMKVV